MKNIYTVSIVALTVSLSACVEPGRDKNGQSAANTPVTISHPDDSVSYDEQEKKQQPGTSVLEQAEPRIVVSEQIPIKREHLQIHKQKSDLDSNLPGLSSSIAIQPASEVDIALPLTHQVANHGAYQGVDRDKYIHFDDNGIKLVHNDPVSTFSIDVDTASYSNVRRMLEGEGRFPPRDAVKVEEMINYFSYDYPATDSLETPFSVTTEIARSPWNKNRHLLQVGLKGYEPASVDRPAANLVFLIDVSGSMMSDDKLPLVKRSLRLLVNQMGQNDSIALAVYAGAAGLVLDSTSAAERGKILRAIEALQAGGSTNGGAGLHLAYDVAAENFIKGGINRVIIASDGDMNVGIADHEALKNLIEQKRNSGIALTTLGFGAGNFNYALMEQLADVGNGNAAYIDTIREAQKVLVNEMQSTLLTIAKDVKIQIEFNPGMVSEYRLIGYENRVLNREDFRNDKVDAGDIGSGHTVTAFYEIALVDSDDTLIPKLRYQPETRTAEYQGHENEIAFVRLRYKQPDANASQEISYPVLASSIIGSIDLASPNMRFATSVAGFGQILRGGRYTGDWWLDDVVALARSARGPDYHGYRGEFIRLVELTRSLDPDRPG
jgi:Ca-activated chloride channel family protein